ncbi:hypothetical protein PUN28_004740 [Cardiocondyla obscurior]|uniref:Uncharacterized protein n=1 Tax=Cardiocondyla obscurior TaxID=286306 RepID=A0AAW2GF17_9HYME
MKKIFGRCTAIYFAPFNQPSISSIYWPESESFNAENCLTQFPVKWLALIRFMRNKSANVKQVTKIKYVNLPRYVIITLKRKIECYEKFTSKFGFTILPQRFFNIPENTKVIWTGARN